MGEMISRQELLLQLSAGHDRLSGWLERIAPDQAEKRGLPGEWSVKNILSHLIGHEQRLSGMLVQGLQSGSFTSFTIQEGDALNAEDVLKYEDQPYAAVRTAWENSYQQVVQAIKALPETIFQLDPTQPNPLFEAIRSRTIDHYEEHLGQILRFILKERYTLQPVTDADWHLILEIADASAPWKKPENLAWLAKRKSFPADRYPRRHYMVIDAYGHPVAYGAVEGSENDWYRLFLVMEANLLEAGPADLLYDRLIMDLRESGAAGVWARETLLDSALLTYLNERGFTEYRRNSDEDGREIIALRRPLPNTCFAA